MSDTPRPCIALHLLSCFPMRYSVFAAFYSRLLRKLAGLQLPLLSESTFGGDFIGISSEGSSHINFVVPGSLLPFEPLIIGTVRHVYDLGQGLVTVELSLPRHATNGVDAMFWNQVACLVGTVRQCSGAPAGIIFEDILEWSTGVRYSSFEADDMRIFVEINPSATVARSTPLHLFEALTMSPTLSDESSASSSTLSSEGGFCIDGHRIQLGDLLVLQCELHCTDFLRPSGSPTLSAIRVFAIRASHIEIIV